jgi:cyanophycinase
MLRPAAAAILCAAVLSATGCAPTNDDIRVIQTGGPVYEVSSQGVTQVKAIAQPAGRGTIILEGGGSYLDAASTLTVADAGPKPVLCLIDTAAEGKGDPYHKFDEMGGVKMLTLDITMDNSNDGQVLEALNSCTGYYFNGGNPELLSKGLLVGQADSRALAVIRSRYQNAGAVIAGTSAGTMILGPITLCECSSKSSINALTKGTLFQAPGYHFVDNMLIDAHFFTRGLIGRQLYALAKTGEPIGLGIDESTAVVVPGDGGLWQVIGESSVALIHRGASTTTARLDGFTISMLNAGDRFDPRTGRVAIAPSRKPVAVGRDSALGPLQMAGIFDPGQLKDLIAAFAPAGNPTAQGYADAEGLAINLVKRPDTAAFADANSISVLNLDIAVSRF